MKLHVRLLIVLLWVASVPGCVYLSRPISEALNGGHRDRVESAEVQDDAQLARAYVVWIPEGEAEDARIDGVGRGNFSAPENQQGSYLVDASQIEAVNANIRLQHSDLIGELETAGDGTYKLSVTDMGMSVNDYTTWYEVAEDGQSVKIRAYREDQVSSLLPLLIAGVLSFGAAFLLTRGLKRQGGQEK